jgi:hypothetical protein
MITALETSMQEGQEAARLQAPLRVALVDHMTTVLLVPTKVTLTDNQILDDP